MISEDTATDQTQPELSDGLRMAAHELFDEVQTQLNLDGEEVSMFVLDISGAEPVYPEVMLVQTSQVQQVSSATARTIGVCSLVENPFRLSSINGVGPEGAAQAYYREMDHREVQGPAVVTLLKAPKHGTLEPRADAPGGYIYHAKADYFGSDRATFLVELAGRKLQVEYFFKVLHGVADDYTDVQYKRLCPSGGLWKISSAPAGDLLRSGESQLPEGRLDAPYPKASLSFADLPIPALSETTDSTITLDTTAAGHGWFIDPTPSDNSEFLPTADPNIWLAKPGSAADGKMDMLSVLLHEYGHVLGLEHSANPTDVMAPTLQPGERRLWSAEELAQGVQMLSAKWTQMANYEAFIAYLQDHPIAELPSAAQLSADHELLAQNVGLGTYAGGWFWSTKDLNAKAEEVGRYGSYSRTQYDRITRAVNGNGMKGATERWNYFNSVSARAYANGNPYESMREVLGRLGISAMSGPGYQSQFGIVLNRRSPQRIVSGSASLIAEEVAAPSAVSGLPSQQELTQALDTQPKEKQVFDLMIPAMEIALQQEAPMLISLSDAAEGAADGVPRVIRGTFSVCLTTPNRASSSTSDQTTTPLEPAGMATDIGNHNSSEPVDMDHYQSKVTVLKKPKHGVLSADYQYTPDINFVGTDNAVFKVEGRDRFSNGMPVVYKLLYRIHVTRETYADHVKKGEAIDDKYCPSLVQQLSSLGRNGDSSYADVSPQKLESGGASVAMPHIADCRGGQRQGKPTAQLLAEPVNAAMPPRHLAVPSPGTPERQGDT